jgi:hypothetical protein
MRSSSMRKETLFEVIAGKVGMDKETQKALERS